MNLKQLEAFVKVAEGGSFSKAAKSLYLTQPTISAHISSLEKELDVRLFVRNTKEVSLSEDGKRLFRYAKEMIELEEKIHTEFAMDANKDVPCITIAASSIPAQYILPQLLARFSEKFPNEQFKIMETDSATVVDKIVEHSVDIGFTGTVLEKKHCKYLPFFKDDLVVITPNTPKFHFLMEKATGVQWIKKESMIMREEGSGTRKEAEKLLKKEGIDPESLNIVASIENSETIKRSVLNGIGVSIMSRLAVTDEINAGTLLAFPLAADGDGRDLNVVYNKNYKLPKSAERFIRVVKEVYGV